jgi:hypothetical protein
MTGLPGGRRPMIGVRFVPAEKAVVKAGAERYFDGNESDLLRAGTRLYLRLRDKLGVQFEPTMALILGENGSGKERANRQPAEIAEPELAVVAS